MAARLAGRAADAMLGAGVTAGAASDLREATKQLAAVHACLGLGATLSALIEPERADVLLREDPALAGLVETDLRRLQGEAERMVRADRVAITALAEALLCRRVLDGAEILALAAQHRPRLRVPAGRGERDVPDGPGIGAPAPRAGPGPAA